jgi:hypothetical protein
MAFSKKYQKVIAIALLAVCITSTCPTKNVLFIDENFKAQCVSCPDKCSICYLNTENRAVCSYCQEGFFLDHEYTCQPCAENCSSCLGTTIDMCKNPNQGFGYDPSSNSITKCNPDYCESCSSSKDCLSCKEGYFISNKTISEQGLAKVECQSCNIENCILCGQKADQVKDASYLTCTLCKIGFGVSGGRCEKCPDNCLYCHEESKECTFCDSGYNLNKVSNTCEKIQIENCYSLSPQGKCLICENHFYLDNDKCVPCNEKIEHCSYCTAKEESMMCLSCQIGYFSTGNTCKACAKDCNHCSSDRCFVCRNGYFFNNATNSCEACQIDNCQLCKTNDVCMQCRQGFYFDKEKRSCQR